MYKQKRNVITLFLCFIVTLACALLTVFCVPVRADSGYVVVSQADFTFSIVNSNKTLYQIALEYKGDTTLHCGGFSAYDTANLVIKTDDADELRSVFIEEYFEPNTIMLSFRLADEQGSIGFKTAKPTKLTIPAGTILTSGCTRGCAGIKFITDFSLYKLSETEWTTEQPMQSYGVEMSVENTSFAWNNEKECLTAQIAVPYTASAGNVYEACFEKYDGEIIAEQTDSSAVTLYFEDTKALQETDGFASFTLPNGTFISQTLAVQVTLAGELTFHKYVDGTWATQKYICVCETAHGERVDRKLLVSETYTLPMPEYTSDLSFIGWENGERLFASGTSFVLSDCSTPVFSFEAVFVKYNLIKGASVRLDSSLSSSGIRFGAVLDTDGADKYAPYLVGFGVIVMPTDMLNDKPFTLENYSGAGEAKYFYVPKEQARFDKPTFTLYGSIVKVLEKNYNRAFSARAYLRVQQGDTIVYVWDEHMQSSSVYEIAQKAYADNIKQEDKKILEAYLNGVLDISNTQSGAQIIGPVISKPATLISCTVDSQVVTLIVETDKESFPCISYNGIRIKNVNQTYQEGKLYIQFQEVK